MGQQASARLNKIYRILAIVFWISVWQLGSMLINKEMLLASPFAVVEAFFNLAVKSVFWKSIFNSFLKIAAGYGLAILIGILLAAFSYCNTLVREMVSPLMKIIQATPVASFIILALLWVSSKHLSVLCSFLMVIPVIFSNVLQGLMETDKKLLEMAQVFKVHRAKKILYIYIPSVLPYFASASTVGLGLCWKAGIAAEVIGLPKNSIGEQLYEAKLYLLTDELFAWTIVIILISILFEKLVICILQLAKKAIL